MSKLQQLQPLLCSNQYNRLISLGKPLQTPRFFKLECGRSDGQISRPITRSLHIGDLRTGNPVDLAVSRSTMG